MPVIDLNSWITIEKLPPAKTLGYSRAAAMIPILGPCERCGAPGNARHHKDRNPLNNERDNLEVLCTLCHLCEHGQKKRPSVSVAAVGAATSPLVRMSTVIQPRHDVQPGQVWVDRITCRRVFIGGIDNDHAIARPVCAFGFLGTRVTRIPIRRFRSVSNGFDMEVR